jgi:hypothetical protein
MRAQNFYGFTTPADYESQSAAVIGRTSSENEMEISKNLLCIGNNLQKSGWRGAIKYVGRMFPRALIAVIREWGDGRPAF